MTVIAYDGKLLVADGRCTRGTALVSDEYRKLNTIVMPDLGKVVIGLTGALDVQGPFLRHLQENGLVPMDDFLGDDELYMRGLLLTHKGECFEISSEGGFFPVTMPMAIGSGAYIAQHFLLTGHDALSAVTQTCMTEFSCGGTFMVYDTKTKKTSILTQEK